MKGHIESVHEEIKEVFCNMCNEKFSTKYKLKRHISHVHKNEKSYECNVCNYKFKSNTELTAHKKSMHEGKKGKIKQCPYCHADFISKALKKHIAIVHEKQKNYNCDICKG